MEELGSHVVREMKADLEVRSTTDRRASLAGADFVISSIAVGGYDAWEKDIEIPGKYGVYMTTADSIGPGGMMRAFRHIPPLVEMCRDLEEVSPNAWVLNFTNPATTNAIAMTKASKVKVVSLCTGAAFPRKGDDEWTGDLAPANLMLPAPAGGINHCAAVLELRFKDGRDALPAVRERMERFIPQWVFDTFGVLPYVSSHWAEFFPSLCRLAEPYRGRLQGLRMEHGLRVHDMREDSARVQQWESVVEQWARGKRGAMPLDDLPEGEGMEVVEIIEALIENRNSIHVVNMANQGAIPNLPDDAIVEVSAVVGGYGIRPVRVGSLPDSLAAHLRQHIAVQELTAEAALTGDRRVALQAFLLDPQVSANVTPVQTRQLLEELLEAHREHLPQFG
jgi:alpha-galactosidase